jgi:hypothetical protein
MITESVIPNTNGRQQPQSINLADSNKDAFNYPRLATLYNEPV